MSMVGQRYVATVGPWAIEGIIERLTAHHAEGLSCSEIARRLNLAFKGAGVTRNGVIGKLGRLGLAGERRAAKPRQVGPSAPSAPRLVRATNPLGAEGAAGMKARVQREITTPAPMPPLRTVAVSTKPVGLLQLGARCCKYAVNDGEDLEHGFLFCGAKVIEGPYCQPHAELAYRPPPAYLSVVASADRRRFNGRNFAVNATVRFAE